MVCQVSQIHQDGAGHKSAGRNFPQDLPWHLAGAQTEERPRNEAHQTEAYSPWGLLSCYLPGLLEREPQVAPGHARQQGVDLRSKDGFRRRRPDGLRQRGEDDHHRHAAEILAHSKGGQELRSLAGPRRKRLRGHFAVHFSIRILLPAEAFVLPGKASGCGLPHTEDAAPRPILPCAEPSGVTREPAVPALLLPSMQTFVCLVVEPGPFLDVGQLPPCLFPPSAWGKSCVPADQSAVSPHPFLADRAATRLAWPLAGVDRSTRFSLQEV
jgi:hypothetical protein